MRLLPVVGRELSAIARRPSAYWIRSGAALAAFLAMGWVAVLGLRIPLLEQGRSLFQILSFGGFAYCLAAGIRGTSDALSEEKREGTLGLLFLTDLKGYDVVFGKFVSLSINSFYGILAIVPALALAFLLGGTSLTQFLLMSLCLVNTLFFSLAVGILVSTFCQNERPAMSGTLGILFAISVMPYAAAGAHTYDSLEIWEVLLPGFLISSPIFAFRTAGDPNLAVFLRDELLLSIAFANLAGWLCLLIASICISKRAHTEAPRSRLYAWFIRFRNHLAYGKAQQRQAIRARSLDRNAFFWLASRDRLKRRYAWIFLALLGTLYGIARWAVPDLVADWPVMLGALWFVHLFFKVWIASEVAARFIEDRRSNALELLLTTPLSLREFANGQFFALLRQFAGPLTLIFILNILAAYHSGASFGYAFQSHEPWWFFIIGLIHLVADFYTMLWVAIWRSQRLRGTNRTILQTFFFVILVPLVGLFLLFQFRWVVSMLFNSPMLPTINVYWRWTFCCLAYDLILVYIARRSFFGDFREIATQHFDQPAKKTAAKKIEAASKPRRIRPVRWAIAAVIVFGILLALAANRRSRFQNEVQQRFADLRSEGFPLTTMEVSQYISAEDNSRSVALLLKQAHAGFVPGLRLEPMGVFIERGDIGRATAYLKTNEAVLKILEDLPNRTPTRQPIDGRNLAPQDSIDLLHLKALVEMGQKDPKIAGTITLLAHLARTMEGNFGTQYASKLALEITQELLERAAAGERLTAAQWAELQDVFSKFNPLESLRTTLVIERANGLELLRSHSDQLWRSFGRPVTSSPSIYAASMAVRRFVGQDQQEILEYLDLMQAGIDGAAEPIPIAIQNSRRTGWRRPSLTTSSLIVPHITPATDWIVRMAAGRLARLRLLQCASAIEIFRAQNARLPETLAEAKADSFLDPFNGRAFQYTREGNGYHIASVGEEVKETGGTRINARRSDLTFRCEPSDSGNQN